jgi:hypothetical protein
VDKGRKEHVVKEKHEDMTDHIKPCITDNANGTQMAVKSQKNSGPHTHNPDPNTHLRLILLLRHLLLLTKQRKR